jgi:fatty acid desaturase
VLWFNGAALESKAASYGPTSIATSSKKRRLIAAELLLIALLHFSILVYLKFSVLAIFLGYLLPIWIGYAGVIFYIYTNHFLCPMTELNDPLTNSVSIKVPKLFDLLHCNFSYHTEHHFFPGINSDYYPIVQEILQARYPERFNLLTVGEAWRGLMQSPRHYQNQQTLTDWSGQKSVPCPCNPGVAASQHLALKE